ncbi:MAG TPA: hypothetical protein VK783_13910 [Bacteroidia bacterium]|jgi:hypothetical protein|nr:hypothetical protein [Bacteroidia bacterium]
MIYSKKQIELLAEALKGSADARSALALEAPELVMLEAGIMTEVRAMQWLIQNHKMLALFMDAVHGNRSAVRILIKMKETGLAAVANLCNGDDNAGEWLKMHHLYHYLKLAEGIKYAHNNRGTASNPL